MRGEVFLIPGVATGTCDSAAAARWAAVVHQAVREARGRVVGPIAPPSAGRNYYRARIQLGDGERLQLRLNAVIGLVAAVDDTDALDLVPAFREVPRPDVFVLAGFQVATASQMGEPLTNQVAGLTKAELKDIAYHRPPRVGDVIFNWFD
jgi:hypothetical protein